MDQGVLMELELPDDWNLGRDIEGGPTSEDFAKRLALLADSHAEEMWSFGLSPDGDWEPDENAPLTVQQAVCLPELGGFLSWSPAGCRPSPTFAVKTLRRAIERGELQAIRPNDKNLFVTRKLINEWMEACLVAKSTKDLSSANANRATTHQASSPTAAPSTSTMEGTTLRQDAVSAMIKNMRKPSKPQS
ncbi:hypothetical protein AWN88_13970 [Agrobacterium tumefaciens]|nr:hypothetical protein AWN88_13970 [Agrobacterium tumefaciens]KAJ33989.1 hypothetical protein BW45_06460 [Agrobacterium tumefaciens]